MKRKAFPKYVDVYNEILKLINDGFYPEGSKLPSEEELAEQMKVSRMTLRQSLLILKEDGIIEGKHGSGNFVKKVLNQEEIGIEEKGNFVRKVCCKKIIDTDISMELKPTTEYIHQIFGRKGSVGLEIIRFYKGEEEFLAYSYSSILTDVLDEFELDLTKKEQIQNFLETDIYEEAHRVRMEMRVLPENQGIRKGMIQSQSKMYLVAFEQAFNQKGELLVHTKHYIPIENVNILMNWHNN